MQLSIEKIERKSNKTFKIVVYFPSLPDTTQYVQLSAHAHKHTSYNFNQVKNEITLVNRCNLFSVYVEHILFIFLLIIANNCYGSIKIQQCKYYQDFTFFCYLFFHSMIAIMSNGVN